MAHEFEQGFFVGEKAWHGLGTVFKEKVTVEQAIREMLANPDDPQSQPWEPEALPLYSDVMTPDGMQRIDVPEKKLIVRSDTYAPLGVVGKDYEPMKHKTAFGFFQPLVDDGTLYLETGVVLRGGKRVCILGKFMDDLEVGKGDVIQPRLLLATGHDGTLSTWITPTGVRVVCMNTAHMAGIEESDEATEKRLVKQGGVCIVHKGDPTKRLEQARTAVLAARQGAMETVEVFKALRNQEVKSTEDAVTWIREVFDPDYVQARKLVAKIAKRIKSDELADDAERRVALTEKLAELEGLMEKPNRTTTKILENFEEAPGSELAGKTAYGLYQASTFYLTHQRSTDNERGVEGNWFGGHAQMNRKALVHAVALL
jgi:phage/plasmid-like protein (TIGR03299 family)